MKCKKIDARSYSHQTLEEIRISAVRRVAACKSLEVVVAGLGMNRRTIYRWLAAYHYGGEAGLQAKAIVCHPISAPPYQCTLALSPYQRLEMSALPEPSWLAALGYAMQEHANASRLSNRKSICAGKRSTSGKRLAA